MNNPKALYIYDGPVYEFDICLSSNWHGETYAVSRRKAMSNLLFKYKKTHNRTVDSKLRLTGELKTEA